MFRTFLLLLGVLLVATPSLANDCANPRTAADSIFVWQRPATTDLHKASACLDMADPSAAHRTAVQLRQILDAKGILVPVSSLPEDPDAESPIVPIEDFPVLVLVKGDDGNWRYGRETTEAVPKLYRETFSGFSLWFQGQMPDVLHQSVMGVRGWQVAYLGLLLLVSWLVGQLLRAFLRNQVLRWLDQVGVKLDEEVYRRTNRPTVLFASIAVVYWGINDLQLAVNLALYAHRITWAAVWFFGLLAAYRFIDVAAASAMQWTVNTESKLDDQLVPLARQAAQIALLVIGGLYFADALGFDVFKLAAGVGIGGLAFALAAQDTVANVFGSVNIFVDKPFQIGDVVVVGGVSGVVEEVGFRSTRVRTFHNSVVTIPNSQITNANVDNLGMRHQRRQKFVVGFTYDATAPQLEAWVAKTRALLEATEEVADGPTVHINDLGASSIDVLVQYHLICDTWDRELSLRSEHILGFMKLAEEVGLSFAFPSTSVYVEQLPESAT